MPCPHTFHGQCPDCLIEAAKQALPEAARMANEEQREMIKEPWWKFYFQKPFSNPMDEEFCGRCGNPLVGNFEKIMEKISNEAERRGYERAKEEMRERIEKVKKVDTPIVASRLVNDQWEISAQVNPFTHITNTVLDEILNSLSPSAKSVEEK